MLRRLLVSSVVVASVLTPASASASAGSATPVRCAAADLRYPFHAGLPDDFGVWRLRVTGGPCVIARAVARAWQRRFERSPTARLPRTVLGFRFRELPPNAAQTYRVRGTRGATVVRFDYVVPNG